MNGSEPAAVLDRAAAVLHALQGRESCTLAQVTRLAGLPRSSAHRILQQLVELGWVERHGFAYALGLRMFELGTAAGPHADVRHAATPVLHELHRATGLTAHLTVADLPDVVHLDRAGPAPATGRGWGRGARQAAVHTAAGRVLLADLDPSSWPGLTVPAPATRCGIRTSADLVRELRAVRARGGVAVDEGSCPGVTVLAVPLGAPGLPASAALSLSGPSSAVRAQRLVGLLRTAAADIWCSASGVPRLRPRVPSTALRPAAVAALQA